MRIEKPSPAIRTAISSAIDWFDKVKITGYRADHIEAPSEESGKDLVLVADESSTIWARFYDLKTMQPMFVGRDGIPKTKLAEIDNERRAGYAWYGIWGAKLPREYAKWKKVNGLE
jgi:PelA/Pel-15E family pectate lyase